jgi:hypothetical protein
MDDELDCGACGGSGEIEGPFGNIVPCPECRHSEYVEATEAEWDEEDATMWAASPETRAGIERIHRWRALVKQWKEADGLRADAGFRGSPARSPRTSTAGAPDTSTGSGGAAGQPPDAAASAPSADR